MWRKIKVCAEAHRFTEKSNRYFGSKLAAAIWIEEVTDFSENLYHWGKALSLSTIETKIDAVKISFSWYQSS